MTKQSSRTPPKSGDLHPENAGDPAGLEDEYATGATKTPSEPPILDRKGSPDIDERR